MSAVGSQVSGVAEKAARLVSLDAYRGFVMMAMVSDGLGLSDVARHFPGSKWWEFLDFHFSHVQWEGCAFWDLIQPSFTFMVGVAMPYSHASRLAKGQTTAKISLHVVYRALMLTFLGVFLRSDGASMTRFTFEDVLSQIGMGYALVYLLIGRGIKVQSLALTGILIGYWLAFLLYPLPGPGFDYSAVGVTPEWGPYTGFFAHWNKNTNLAWAFDTWFMNLFPREAVFTHNGGGYSTLSFIPTLGTMILGLIAGHWLRSESSDWAKVKRLVMAGVIGLGAGWLLGAAGVCPVVKRIWTPTWVLYSGGWCFLLLALFYGVVEMARLRFWFFPLIVIGMNSIASYLMDWLFVGFIRKSLHTHLGEGFFLCFGEGYQKLVEGGCILVILWLILFWMYRRKLFLKI